MQYILSFHKGSLSKAISDLFPSIGIDKAKFINPCMSFYLFVTSSFILYFILSPFLMLFLVLWQDKQNRRRFFEKYAKENGFDPLVANDWSLISKKHLMATKVHTCLSFLFSFFLIYLLFIFKLVSNILNREQSTCYNITTTAYRKP